MNTLTVTKMHETAKKLEDSFIKILGYDHHREKARQCAIHAAQTALDENYDNNTENEDSGHGCTNQGYWLNVIEELKRM